MTINIVKECLSILRYYSLIRFYPYELEVSNMKKQLLFQIVMIIYFSVSPFKLTADSNRTYKPDQSDTFKLSKEISEYNNLILTDSLNARIFIENALAGNRREECISGIAKEASLLGKYYLDRFNLNKAESLFLESLEASKKSNNRLLLANDANNLGTISEKKGDYSNAISNYLFAYEIFDSLENIEGISVTSNNIGIIYYLLNEPSKALNFLQLSLNLRQQLRDSLSLVYAYQNLGNVYFDLWEYDSSKYYFRKCTDLARSVNDKVSSGKALNSLGVISMIENDYNQSFILFSQSISHSKTKNDFQNISSVYDNLGLLNFNTGKFQEAIAYFDSSLALSSKYGLKEEMKDTYQHLAAVYEKKQNYRDAFNSLISYDKLQNKMLTEKSNVSGVEGFFVKQKQENKILVMEKEHERRKASMILVISTFIVLMITSLLGFYIYLLNQRSKNVRKLAELEKERFKAVIEAQEMERKRIAGDLHDSVGQMLSLSKLHLSEVRESVNVNSSEKAEMLERSAQIIDEACQEIRNISHNLMPGSLIRLGLFAGVRDLVRKLNASKKIHVSLYSNLDNTRLDEKVEISVYRIIQEIFNNILKHAQASEIGIKLIKVSERKLELFVTDDGIGFDKVLIEKSTGIGWKNIYSRLSIINGTMEINSTLNSGTIISIMILL